MEDEAMKQRVTELLESFDFRVVELPTGPTETPDLHVESEKDSYLIELKELLGDPAEVAAVCETLERGEIAEIGEPWTPRNKLAGIARKAKKQVEAAQVVSDFRLVWFDCAGRDPESQQKRVFATLYGTTNVYDIQDGSFFKECYYFHDSVFFRWRNELDGAVVMWGEGGALYLNSYSPRFEALRDSALASAFKGGVVDPFQLEREGISLIADCEIDRKDSAAVKRFLGEKCGRPMLDHMNLGKLTMIART